jgi:tetratricopeptide (TPR) repeat protein
VIVSGVLDRRGADYRLSVRAVQIVTGKVLVNSDETAASKDDVLFAVTKLGTAVRKALGDSTSESAQRFSMETLTAASLEAVHEYAAALDLLSQGKLEEALQHFSQAVDLDPNFGLAYAGMAVASHNLGRGQDAEKYIKQAITKIDHMTERERFRTRAFLYLQIGDQQKCVDEYGALLGKYPSDTGALNNMALCSSHLRNMPTAVEDMRRVVAILPKRALYHVNLSVYAAYSGDFQTAAKEARIALQLNPSYGPGFQAQALASLGQEQVSQAAEAYRNLEKGRPSDAATGLADLAVYEGRFREAVSILEKGAAADTAAGRKDDAADKYSALAYTQLLRGEKAPALQAARNALALSPAPKTRFVAGRVYVALGEAAMAQELSESLSKELQIEPQAYGQLIRGEAALKNGDGRGAVELFTKANGLLDTWIGRFDLGRAYLEIGAFTEADSEFDRCLKRRGEAFALFVDIVPTYGYFPAVYYYQGRARKGMKSAGFAESYKKYLDIRGKAGEDPLLAEVGR